MFDFGEYYWKKIKRDKDIFRGNEKPKDYDKPFWNGFCQINLFKLHPYKKFMSSLHKIHWMDNKWLTTGYRKMPSHSIKDCLLSIFSIHNETVNIWTHFLPGLTWIAMLICMIYTRFISPQVFLGLSPEMPIMDWLVFVCLAIGTIYCFMASTLFHSLRNHSVWGYHFFLSLDFIGIIALVGAANLFVIYFEFLCYPTLRIVSLIYLFSFFFFCFFLIPFINNYRLTNTRTFVFFIFGATAGAVYFIKAVILQWNQFEAEKFKSISGLLLSYILVGTSLVLRTVKFPEFVFKKLFDIFGASHQYFHLLTLVIPYIIYFKYINFYNTKVFNYCLTSN